MNRPTNQPANAARHQPEAAANSVDTATLALLAAWKAEDATADPEKIRAAEEDLAEFKARMNDNRKQAGERLVFP